MTKLINIIMGWTILGLIVFAFIGRRNQEMVMTKLGEYFKADIQSIQTFIRNMREDNASNQSRFNLDKTKYSQESIDYFNEIAMGTEDGKRFNEVTRFTTDVKIFMEGHQPQYILDELSEIVSQLNEIINTIQVSVVNSKEDANLIVTIGSLENIRSQYRIFKSRSYDNSNGGFAIGDNFANCYLNTDNIKTVEHAKHVLREEITQSLGLMNDSFKYPESIFYQGYSEHTEYTPIDRELIDMLYNN